MSNKYHNSIMQLFFHIFIPFRSLHKLFLCTNVYLFNYINITN